MSQCPDGVSFLASVPLLCFATAIPRTNDSDLEPVAVARAQRAALHGAAEGPTFVTDHQVVCYREPL